MSTQPTPPLADPPEFEPLPKEFWPNVDHLVIEDGAPVDGIYSERQMRLLTEPLYVSWKPEDGQPFVALANVAVFFALKEPPIVPDVLLSLDVCLPPDLDEKQHNSYFVWVFGKPPDLAVQIVSNREGGEDTSKPKIYARAAVPYYVIWDPANHLKAGKLRVFALRDKKYEPIGGQWFPVLGLGLTTWQGEYEGFDGEWLRWCDQRGGMIPTGKEKAEQEKQRAEQEKQRAEQEKRRADTAQQRADKLAAQLRALGQEPSGPAKE